MPMNTQNSPDLSSKEFSVDNPSVPSVPVPPESGTQLDRVAGDPLRQSQQVVQQSSGNSGGSGIGGDIAGGLFGAIGKGIGAIFGGLFAEGGYVGSGFTGSRPLAGDKANGFAEGGRIDNEHDPRLNPDRYIEPPNKQMIDALSLGYLTGALHQEKYGGTPDTLHQAAQEIKQHLSNQATSQQFAVGGEIGNPDVQLAQQALQKAMGLGSAPPEQTSINPQQSQQVPTNTANAVTAAPQIQTQPQPVPSTAPPSPQTELQQVPRGFASPKEQYSRAAKPQGRGFAAGGPEQQPLAPGQPFQGDGSVKGPGGPSDDAIPAKLSNGEFVMSAPAVQFFGVDKLNKLNEQGKAGFMQAMGQVQANQTQSGSQAAAPQAVPQSAGMMQPPMPQTQHTPPQPAMMQAKGGPSLSLRKNSGYMGL